MDPVENPFRPGAGRRPPVLAGRERILSNFDVVVRRAENYGEGDRSWVINGLRGVGKTVLLNELMSQANARKWIVAKVEATTSAPLRKVLATELVKALRTATGRHADRSKWKRVLGVLRSFTLKLGIDGITLGIDVDPVHGVADSGTFGDDLAALLEVIGEASLEFGIGTLILVDELQEAGTDDLEAVNMAVHSLGQAPTPLPVFFVGAGLPSLPAQLADAASYAERLYVYQPIGLLSPDDVRTALVEPCEQRGVTWQEDALAAAFELARGYPYFVQSIGKHVWDLAAGPAFTMDDVQAGGALAREEIDAGLYRSRWERATTAQRRLLTGMAHLKGEDPVEIGELAAHLGKARTSDLSVARQELIKKGLVYAPERGLVAFTVPGMADFVIAQDA